MFVAHPRRRSQAPALAGLLLMGLLSLAGGALATQLEPLDLGALTARASHIVVGVVEGQRALWSDAARSSIVTEVRVRVTRGMRGAREGEVVTLRRLGGSVDGIGMRVVGEAGFSVGEEVLLFAEPRGEALSAVGMAQGKLHVATEGGRKVVYGSLAGAELVPGAGAARAAATAGPRPLDDVLREVAALVQQKAPSKAAAPARGAK